MNRTLTGAACALALVASCATPSFACRRIYVIGGQSNAAGILSGVPGGSSNVVEIDSPDGRSFVGYAVGSTTIGWWGDPANNAPLVRLLQTFCSTETVLVWDQGEADTRGEDDAQNYRRRLGAFLDETIKPACPLARILIVKIHSMHPIQEEVRQAQASAGYPTLDSNRFDLSADQVHLSVDGLAGLVDAIQAFQ